MSDRLRYSAPLLHWSMEGKGQLGYVSVTGDAADFLKSHELMRRLELGKRRGFGSIKVKLRCGDSRWMTSAFPQQGGSWFLPIKKAIQKAEGLLEGHAVELEIEPV
ncbi:MAG: DUF1905 domain-containing protein [Proteobacteria bacterium]|nr:MAG: DUF1905 domain-containing protein [Pseudomonadota bacterium]